MHDENEGTTPPEQPAPARPAEAAPEEGKRDRSGRGGTTRAAAPVPALARLKSLWEAVGGVLSAALLVAAGGGLVAAAALSPQGPGSRPLQAPLAAVPAGNSVGICPGPARLLEGAPVGTDPQFSPESATAKSAVNAVVLSSSAGELPGSRLAALTGGPLVELAKAAPASATPSPAPAAPALRAGVVPQRAVDAASVLSADAQGNQQPSAGAVMSACTERRSIRLPAPASPGSRQR